MTTLEEPATQQEQHRVPPSIFRAYDIRGVVDEELTFNRVVLICQAIGSEALSNGIDTLLVARDGRLSSPEFAIAVKQGLMSTGCNVVDLGMVPTPLLYFATHTTAHTSGVMLTASHNPSNYNGLKIVFNRTCLADNQIQRIRQRIEQGELVQGKGQQSSLDVSHSYYETICSKISLARRLRVVVDCGNAVAGTVAPTLFERLGCEVIPLFCEVDGTFPNHHPDPTVPHNTEMLADAVRKHEADLGIGFDGDGDRLGIVTNLGEFVDADRMMMLLVKDIAPRYPAMPIIFDVKCSTRLAELIRQQGATPLMHRSGHSFMKQKMQETQAPLGGEFAAHIFIKDQWFGYDDGMYAAARILALLSRLEHDAHEEFARTDDYVSTSELKVPVKEEEKFQLIEAIMEQASFPGATLITLDGLRVEFSDCWGLIRASNTSPALLLRFEADNAERLAELKAQFKKLINTVDNTLVVEF